MSNQTALEFLLDLVSKLQIYLARPSIQIQLVTILIIMVAVYLLAKIITLFLRERSPKQTEAAPDQTQAPTADPSLRLGLQQIVAPLLGLIGAIVGINVLLSMGQTLGLLRLLLTIFWVFLGYRLFVGILYTFFPAADVSRFHTRLFGPLFALFVLYQILSLFVDVGAAAGVVLTSTFENPLTFGAIFIATVGLYFWIDAIGGLNDIIFRLVTKYTAVNEGRLEASLALGGYILIGVGLVVVLSSLGVSATTFAAITGGLSIGVGFALKEILSNFVSGIILLFEGSIRPGDYIEAEGGKWVQVEKLNIRSTHTKTWSGIEIIVPNEKLLSAPVVNFTSDDYLHRVQIEVQTTLDADPKQVIELMKETLSGDPRLEKDNYIRVYMKGFTETGMLFFIRVWIDASLYWWDVYTDFYTKLLDQFAAHDIKIAVPHRDIRIHSELPWLNDLPEHSNGNEILTGQPEPKAPRSSMTRFGRLWFTD
ncbi:mechanosensitive ion channel [Chloroflexi bacterium TSY]|nr:mechanosensitive ion channel [Chloroflexi bacterium TSY]